MAASGLAATPLSTGAPEGLDGLRHVEHDENRSTCSLGCAWDIIRGTPIPTIVLAPSLSVLDVSDSYCHLSGLRREQLLDCHLDAICDSSTLPSPVSVTKGVQVALENARPHQLDIVRGESMSTLRIIPIYRPHDHLRYIIMELEDVTEAHRKQLELEERIYTNETFRILVETVKDYAIFMLDPKGNVATWNAGAEAFKGYTKSEIIGKHFSNFYSQQDRENGRPERQLRLALRDGRSEDEGWRYRKDGTRFWANVVITPVRKNDVLLGFGKVTRDLSERKKAESTLIAAYEEASKLKSEFLANMSHEIRTPMHGMLSALTLLLDTELNPEQVELARVIQDSGDVLLRVINDILDYSKLASGSFSISHGIISVHDIVQSVLRVHQKCPKPGVSVTSSLDPKLPRAAEGDNLRYRQIVQNLLSNAIKFTEKGYVHVRATLKGEDAENYCILTEVVDTGIGIPSAVSNALFTPFMQFDNSATKRFQGTGLGLSICKSLAELMNGEIGYTPNPNGSGSLFWFTARLKKVQQPQPVQALQAQLESLNRPSTPVFPFEKIKKAACSKRILLAEDNPINRTVMTKMLTGLGFHEIDLAADGEEAVKLTVKTTAPPYHLILMDISMPRLDGVQATRQIRDAGLHTPIIAMTANALKGQAESYIAKGMTGYVAKPVDRNKLVNLLLSCLQHEHPDS